VKIFIDTNILIYQTFEDFEPEKHRMITERFEDLYNQACSFFISGQIIREYVAIATNSKIFKKPLNSKEILIKVSEFQNIFDILYDTNQSIEILKQLISRYKISGHKIHDANIAATVIANQIDFLWTFNRKDFKQFNEINLLPLN